MLLVLNFLIRYLFFIYFLTVGTPVCFSDTVYCSKKKDNIVLLCWLC